MGSGRKSGADPNRCQKNPDSPFFIAIKHARARKLLHLPPPICAPERAVLASTQVTEFGVFMSKGFWAGDAIATGMEMATMGMRANADASASLERTKDLVSELAEVTNSNAGNLAEKQALREALKKMNPNHPLLTNTMLQEKIREAGKRVLAISNNWDDVRNAGGNYRY